MSLTRHRVTPFLWYDGQAEEAARFYIAVFAKRSRLTSVSPMSVTFELEGQPFVALNGGPLHKFSEAVSLFVDCKNQREVDYYWQRLGDGGEHGRCGWLKDRWGLSWQIVPRALGECLNGRDKAGAKRAMEAMLRMSKLDVAQLRAAYRGPRCEATTTSNLRRPPKARRGAVQPALKSRVRRTKRRTR
jgi:predicted 3-demethylubiquinone-9 3-methyltransferase (glyoxalase superfamily)